jgi:hypothetical protein
MRARTRRLLLTSAVLVTAFLPVGAAEAHPPPFFWMPDLSVHSRESFETSVGPVTLDRGVAIMAEGDVYIELAVSRNISVMGRLPFGYVRFDPVLQNGSGNGFALGNIGAGAQIANTTELRPERKLLYGLGVFAYLPTASGGATSGPTVQALRVLSVPDGGRFLQDTTTLRVRGGLRFEMWRLFFQGETVLERRILEGDDRNDLTFGLGAGFQISEYLAVLGELTMAPDLLDLADDNDYTAVIDAGLRYHNPQTMIGLRVYMPLESPYRDAGVIGVIIDAGMRY